MRRTIDFTSPRGVLVVLIGLLLVLAAPTIAQARGTARGAEADSSLIAAGAGYGSPQGSVRVGAVQHRLVRAGERPGPADGLYGPLTQDAVERFQAGEGLAVDGIVGPQTARALSRQTTLVSDGAGYSRPDGSTRVRGLQHRLRRAGDRPGTLDGRFGPRTQGAVERFQASHGAGRRRDRRAGHERAAGAFRSGLRACVEWSIQATRREGLGEARGHPEAIAGTDPNG